MGLGKGTERKGAEKSRIKGAGRIAVWRQRRKVAQPQRSLSPRAADCIRPRGARCRVTHECDAKEALAASKGTPSAFQTVLMQHGGAPD